MPEPITTVGVSAIVAGASAYVTKDVILKILGPTADYLGGELRELTKKRMENVGRIFSNAKTKLSNRLDTPGQVPPKVLKTIIDEGSFSDDKVVVEYFGGVLASSRSEVSRDDRGARIAKMVDNLSAYQIRTHYLIYSTISELFSNSVNNFNRTEDRRKMQLFIPSQGYAEAMEFTQREWDNPQILIHIFHGLETDGLIENVWGIGNQESLKRYFHTGKAPGEGIVCAPSTLGVELLLWAFGHGDRRLDFLLTGAFLPEIEGISKSVSNAMATNDVPDESNTV